MEGNTHRVQLPLKMDTHLGVLESTVVKLIDVKV